MSKQNVTVMERPVRSVLADMAERYGMEIAAFEATLRATVIPKDCSREQFAAFLLVAKEYELNPLLKEIYAFPTRGGGIQPIVGVDGWANLINSHPQFDGMEFVDAFDEKKNLESVTCKMFRKDRGHPISATEYMSECKRATDPWKQWPARMLRHKAMIQCARYAFGFAGIYDPDEAERIAAETAKDVTPLPRKSLTQSLDALAAQTDPNSEASSPGATAAENKPDFPSAGPEHESASLAPANDFAADESHASSAGERTAPVKSSRRGDKQDHAGADAAEPDYR